ncbi:MAG: FecR domain-containing protein [Sphingobacteriia bacterium]|nr:FecR domain-containing protein [Sphingobacteriia bacterium]
MTPERINALYARKLSGEASINELQELEDLLKDHLEEQFFQEMFTGWWESGKNHSLQQLEDKDRHFDFILQNAGTVLPPDKDSVTPIPVRKRSLAAYYIGALAAAVIAGFVFFYIPELISSARDGFKRSAGLNEIVTKKGTKSKLLLPDGTKVWLNSDSRLYYADNFSGTQREVRLEGEAFFDVVKDSKRPFIVKTSGINIRVLGTAFNVKSYPQEPTIEATLVRGLIEVEKNNQPAAPKIKLHPNEKLVFNKEDGSGTKTEKITRDPVSLKTATVQSSPRISITTLPENITDSSRMETSWVFGKLLFEGDTFRELAAKMERWFNVRIIFKSNRVANYRFRGVFENENIVEALQALQLTASFNFKIIGNEVYVDRK